MKSIASAAVLAFLLAAPAYAADTGEAPGGKLTADQDAKSSAATDLPSATTDAQQLGAEPKEGAGMATLTQQGDATSISSDQLLERVKDQLRNAGYKVGEPGILDETTRDAIREFQKAQGLEQTGEIDDELLAKMDIEGEDDVAKSDGDAASDSQTAKSDGAADSADKDKAAGAVK